MSDKVLNRSSLLSPTFLGVTALTMTCIVGGTSYGLSKELMGYFNPSELITYRFFLGALTLILFRPSSLRQLSKEKLKLTFPTGAVLAFSMLAMWQGVKYSDTGLSAFIANSEFIIIPIISYLFFGQKISLKTLLLVFLGLIGMALLSFQRDFEISYGTVILLICATGFAFYAVLNTELTKKLDTFELSLYNLLWSTFFCAFAALIEGYTFKFSYASVLPLLYLGPVVLGIRFAFITYGQSKVKVAHAGLIYLTEPVTAALIGCYLLGEAFSPYQLLGIMILMGTVLGSFLVVSQEEGLEERL